MQAFLTDKYVTKPLHRLVQSAVMPFHICAPPQNAAAKYKAVADFWTFGQGFPMISTLVFGPVQTSRQCQTTRGVAAYSSCAVQAIPYCASIFKACQTGKSAVRGNLGEAGKPPPARNMLSWCLGIKGHRVTHLRIDAQFS
jgi:hypothetical protein